MAEFAASLVFLTWSAAISLFAKAIDPRINTSTLLPNGARSHAAMGLRYGSRLVFCLQEWMSIVSTTNHSQNVGYGIGVDVGNAEFLKMSFLYALVERNAAVAAFTDSDMFDGFTNARGIMIGAERILAPGAQPNCAAQTQDNLPALFCDTTALNPLLADYRRTSLDRWRLQVDLRVDF